MKAKKLILVATLLLSVASGFAQGGTIGSLTWNLENGTLTISGEGFIPNCYPIPAPWDEYRESIYTVVMGNGITGIGEHAFYKCTSLTSVTIPCNVTSIRFSAFRCCTSLASIEVENENNSYTSENGVLLSKSKIFLICCPAGKTGNCIIPNGVTHIVDGAFSYCANLTSITIPESVISIEWSAFYNCTSLTSVTNFNPVPVEIYSDVFKGVNISACTLEVPVNSVYAYQNANVWKEFNIVGIEVGVEELRVENGALKIHPNPAKDFFILNMPDGWTKGELEMFNLGGRCVHKQLVTHHQEKINMEHLPAGVYLYRLLENSQVRCSGKISKNN